MNFLFTVLLSTYYAGSGLNVLYMTSEQQGKLVTEVFMFEILSDAKINEILIVTINEC